MSLLTIVQRAAKRTGLFESPSSVVGNANKAVQKALELLTEIGDELVAEYDWQALEKEQTFSTIASTVDYTIASVVTDGDFDVFISDSFWNRDNNNKIQIVGTSEWQRIQSQIGISGGFDDYIYYNQDQISIYPTPSAIETIAFNYRSSYWRKSSGGTGQADWLADTDTSYFKEDFLYLGLVSALKKEFGVPYFDDESKFEKRKDLEKAQSKPSNTLVLTPDNIFPIANTPDTGVGA